MFWSPNFLLGNSCSLKNCSLLVLCKVPKKDAFGITSLRENGILKTDTVYKTNICNICNKQFQSAFTRETDSEIPSNGTSPFTAMGEIAVDPLGAVKLFNGLKVLKAPGPGGLSARVLRECSSEIAPFWLI